MTTEINRALHTLRETYRCPLSGRDEVLLRRAVETLYGNIIPCTGDSLPCWENGRSLAPAMPRYVGHWNWDSAFHAMTLVHWDAKLAREQADILFSFQHENGCLPNVIFPDGRIADNRSQPPVWFWAYREIDETDPDDEALCRAYCVLTKYEQFWRTRRQTDGLFRYDADEGKNPYFVKYESGWDTSPRWDTYLPDVLWPIDLNGYMVMAYRSLAYMASRLGKKEQETDWNCLAGELASLINQKLWHEEEGAYMDTVIKNGQATGVLTPASFMPLFVGIADERQAARMAELAGSAQKFYPLMPSVAYDSPAYTSGDYFRGPTWLNTGYMAILGLKRYGYTELAEGYRQRLLRMCAEEERNLFEYYDSRSGEGRGACGYGWTASMLIRLILQMD